MLDLIFVILFFIFPIFAIKYMNKIGLDIFTISIPTFLIISIFVFAYIGVLPLYFSWDEYRVSLGVTDKEILFNVFLFNCLTLVGILFGFSFSKNVLKLNFSQSIDTIKFEQNIGYLVLLLIFCIVVFCIYLSKINEIALFVRIQEAYNPFGISRFDIVRSDMTNNFPGKYHWYSLFMHNILVVVTLASFIMFLKKKTIRGGGGDIYSIFFTK